MEESLLNNMSAMSKDLDAFYKSHAKAHPLKPITPVNRIDHHLVGTNSERKMTSKGAQTHGLMLFMAYFLEKHLARFSPEARLLLDAVRACLRMVEIWRENKFNVEIGPIQECFDCLNQAYSKTEHIEELNTPKKHLCVHLVYDMQYFGNPRFYSNFFDESLNKLLKSFCRLVSQGTFESFLLLRMRDGLKVEAQKRKAEVL